MRWCRDAQDIALSNHKLKSALTCIVWSRCTLVPDRPTDGRTNIMAIARRFVLTNVSRAENWPTYVGGVYISLLTAVCMLLCCCRTVSDYFGVTYALHSIARWKARGRLYIRHNWTFFAIFYGWDVISGNLSKSAFLEGGGWVTLSADFRGKGASPTNHCWCQSSRVIVLSCGIKISAVHHLVLSQSTRVTDRRTDGRTELRLPRPSLHMFGQ